jgi:uncharacterized protein YecE (DUF72 family)
MRILRERVLTVLQEKRIYIGTSGWNYDDWKVAFYPERMGRAKWLAYYARHFSTVEVNATFYRTFQDSVFERWAGQVPADFRFVLKAPRIITHRKYLAGADGEIADFCRKAKLLGERFGIVLLQLDPNTPVEPGRLDSALAAFGDTRVAVEFRDDRWITGEIQNILEERGAAFCAADSPKARITEWVTADTGYIRLHGRKAWYSHRYGDSELADIAAHARNMIDAGARTMYIFFNNDYRGYAIENAMTLNKMLDNASC